LGALQHPLPASIVTKSILLADDSATIRKVVELTFSDSAYHVESVSSGAEALARLELLKPDVVLADVVMPGPSGYEICRRIKESDRPVPVLLLAGTFEAFDHDEARASGADGCLLKPFDARTLRDRVDSLLADREAMTRSALEPFDPEAAGHVATAEVATPEAEELPPGLDGASIDAIARAVVRRLSAEVVRQIAREVVPRVAEELVRQRIRELESEES
jgi:CheY-like chemotaxis protein